MNEETKRKKEQAKQDRMLREMGIAAKKAQEERDFACDMFVDWIQNYPVKAFDLDNAKSDLFYMFVKRNVNGDYSSATSLAAAILKSQFMRLAKEENGLEKLYAYVDQLDKTRQISIEDLRLRHYGKIVEDFLNEKILDEKNRVTITSIKDIYKACAQSIISEMEEIYGNIIFLPLAGTMAQARDEFVAEYSARGYKPYKKDTRFLIKDGPQEVKIVEEHQPYLLRSYGKVVKDYVMKVGRYVTDQTTIKNYDEFWGTIKSYLDNIESRMTEETKASAQFEALKLVVNDFFEVAMDRIKKIYIPEGKKGDYYNNLTLAFKNFCAGKASAEDKKILADFYARSEELSKTAFAKRNDKGAPEHPVNYFACMPMHPMLYRVITSRIIKSGILTKEQHDIINDARTCVGKVFNQGEPNNKGYKNDIFHIDVALSEYRMSNGAVNFIDDENFAKLIEETRQIMQANNLPESSLCAKSVAHEIVAGRHDTDYLKKKREEAGKAKTITD